MQSSFPKSNFQCLLFAHIQICTVTWIIIHVCIDLYVQFATIQPYLTYFPKWLPRIQSCSHSYSVCFFWENTTFSAVFVRFAHRRLCFEDMFRAGETAVLDDLLGKVKRMKGTWHGWGCGFEEPQKIWIKTFTWKCSSSLKIWNTIGLYPNFDYHGCTAPQSTISCIMYCVCIGILGQLFADRMIVAVENFWVSCWVRGNILFLQLNMLSVSFSGHRGHSYWPLSLWRNWWVAGFLCRSKSLSTLNRDNITWYQYGLWRQKSSNISVR